MGWILVMVLITSSGTNTTTVQYTLAEPCEAAGQQFLEMIRESNTEKTPVSGFYTCTSNHT